VSNDIRFVVLPAPTPTPTPVCYWWEPCWPVSTPYPTPTPTPKPSSTPTPTPTPVCYWWEPCWPVSTPYPTQSVIYQSDRIAVQKLGKNITQGENIEKSSLVASPNDTLEFVIRVKSIYSSTLYNVTVVDALPYGLSYIYRTTSINGILTSDGITSQGLNIGSLNPNQEIIIRFNVLVGPKEHFSIDTTSVTNTVRVFADNTSAVTAQLPISIVKGKVAGVSISKVAGVATGTAGSLAISLLLSILITYGYINYTKTGLFKKREILAVIKEHRLDKDKFNFISR
jgi:uncharacterized repeat protein (TIGR01451 family)